jgi:hypothetical protein
MNAEKTALYKLKYLLLTLAMSFAGSELYATHQRAGEITYRHISGLTYEVTITTYTFAPSAADRCELTINWGDGQSSVLSRTNGPSGQTPAGIFCEHTGENITLDIRLNIYTGVHTYAAPSTYRIWLEDPNRNLGIQNIPNSVDVPLYIETLLVINPFLGGNNSPVLLLVSLTCTIRAPTILTATACRTGLSTAKEPADLIFLDLNCPTKWTRKIRAPSLLIR